MTWRVAKSLERLRFQLNALYPNRSKVSDGGIGNAEHASRSSDHNPWVKDSKGQGVVTARDFTFDDNPADGIGIDGQKLVDCLVANRDPRIKYIIWNRRIVSSKTQPWVWRPYSGANAHKHHVHISVSPDEKLFDDDRPWNLDQLKPFKDLREDEIVLEVPKISAAASAKNSQIPAPAAEVSEIQTNAQNTSIEPPPMNISGESERVGLTGDTQAEQKTAANQAPAPETTQNAEQITNISTGDKPVPDNFVPEQKTVNAPPKEGSTEAATKMTIAGFVVPTCVVAVIKTIQDLIAQGFVSAADVGNAVVGFITANQKYFFYLILGIIALMAIKKLTKQMTLWLKMWLTADPNKHDVEVKPS
jgi:hypothetical protein